jgi:3-hydroxyisobutyrate dehydrogenase
MPARPRDRRCGRRPLGAPVSGGVVGATTATLTFAVGGENEPFDEVHPCSTQWGGGWCTAAVPGPVRRRGVQQPSSDLDDRRVRSFVLAERLRAVHEALFDVASVSSGSCWALTANCPVPVRFLQAPNNEYRPGFAAALMLKDLRLATAAADSTRSALDLGRHATEVYEEFVKSHGGDLDFSAVIEAMREGAGKEL